jgi:hypothetical protein
MRALDLIRKISEKIAENIATSRRLSRFTCGDCERNERCGLPPDDKCVVKAMQIARDGDDRARPPTDIHPAMWPGSGTSATRKDGRQVRYPPFDVT